MPTSACVPLPIPRPWLTAAVPAPRPRPVQAAEQLRPIWRSMHEQHSYPEYDAEWARVVLIFSCASRSHLVPNGASSPPPQDVAAMLVD